MDKLTQVSTAVHSFYYTEKNKKYVYALSIASWALVILSCFSVLTFLLVNHSVAWFYVLFFCVHPILCVMTHFMLHSLLAVPPRDIGLPEPQMTTPVNEPYLSVNDML